MLLSLLILAGNNFAPIFLRGLLRMMHILSRWCSVDRDAVRYALDHPRQVRASNPSRSLTVAVVWCARRVESRFGVVYPQSRASCWCGVLSVTSEHM